MWSQQTFPKNFCLNLCNEIAIDAFFLFSHYKSMESFSCYSKESNDNKIINIVEADVSFTQSFSFSSHMASEEMIFDFFFSNLAFWLKYRSNFGEVDVAPAKNDKVNKLEKWQKLTAGLNPNQMHIFKPWKKRCAKLHKDRHEIV